MYRDNIQRANHYCKINSKTVEQDHPERVYYTIMTSSQYIILLVTQLIT